MTTLNMWPFLLMAVLLVPAEASAQVQPSRLFSDGMVMQRGVRMPVWGTASPGTGVEVRMAGVERMTTADSEGKWVVHLPAMTAGGPHTMTIAGGSDEFEIGNVLVGDVWIASGQSNMEWTVRDSRDAEREMAAADDSRIRHYKVPRTWSETPLDTLAGGSWAVASPETVGEFSAVGYFFARSIRESEDVPIGIVNSTWGGSRIEPWMSGEMLNLTPEALRTIFEQERERERVIRERVEQRIGRSIDQDPGMMDGRAVWAAPDLDDSSWFDMPVPAQWEPNGFDGMDGVAWYRTTFDLTAAEASSGVVLGLGMIDDTDVTWVNGERVGGMENAWNQARVYEVPASALREGRNVTAVRVEDYQGGGGIAGPEASVFLKTRGEQRSLAGTWKFMVGRVTIGSTGNKNQVATLLWNAMIHPLLPMPITGVIWYQGESNAGSMQEAVAYESLFKEMISGWRDAWGQGDFPFLWAQLANYMEPSDEPPAESAWARLRDAQTSALDLPNTGQAVLIDIGEADDIHPRNKQDIGRRLALDALNLAYDRDVTASGPTYRSHEVMDGAIRVSFDHAEGGLVVRGDDPGDGPGGFAIAGPDNRFVWAKARIDGTDVVLTSDEVERPVHVRYAWSDNPVRANIYNQAGLPAVPFRTDAPAASDD